MGKKGKKGRKPPAAASAAAPAASADAPADTEADADPVDPAPAKDSSGDSSDDESSSSGTTTSEGDEPRERALSQPRSPAVEDVEAHADRDENAGASDHLAMELASLRARCVSLEAEAEAASREHAEALRSLRAEKDALARSHLTELARAREVADAHASSAKRELVSAQAMSSAQRAKIDALSETVSELEETLETRERERDSTRAAATAEAVALALAAADAKHEDAMRAAVASGREALRRAYVAHAAAKSAWAAEKIGLVEARGDAVEREAEEAARVARLARAAVRSSDDSYSSDAFLAGLTEQETQEALLSPGAALRALFAATTPSRSRAALAAADEGSKKTAADSDRRASSLHDRPTEKTSDGASSTSGSDSDAPSSSSGDRSSSDDGSSAGSSRGDERGAAAKASRSATLADLLDDAMEDELSASVARGYCVDAETGELVVGAGAIVECVMAKYRGDAATGASRQGKNLSPLFSPSNAGAPGAFVHADAAVGVRPASDDDKGDDDGNDDKARRSSPSATFARRLERARARRERAILLAELQRCRADLDRARLEARRAETRDEAIDSTSATYEREEEACVRRLELASEVRARALATRLEEARKKAVPPSALRAVRAELGELRARLARLREAQGTSARLIAPTVASALACLKLGEREM